MPDKQRDLRDQTGRPATTVTNTDSRLAGSEPEAVRPKTGEPLRTPEVGKVPDGQVTKN